MGGSENGVGGKVLITTELVERYGVGGGPARVVGERRGETAGREVLSAMCVV